MLFLGIDTSNYTTSAALYDSSTNTILQKKKLLPVKSGEKGLRQSDAVFHHTVQLPQVVSDLAQDFSGTVDAFGVSVFPRRDRVIMIHISGRGAHHKRNKQAHFTIAQQNNHLPETGNFIRLPSSEIM